MTTKSKTIKFTKMVAVGNDSLIINCLGMKLPNPNLLAKRMCNRKNGVGADQMILLIKSRKADFGMKTYNMDGSEAEACGNGIRSLARYIKDKGLSQKKELTIETVAGIRKVKIKGKMIEAEMGEPKMKGNEIPVNFSGRVVNRPLKLDTKDFRITCVSMGNPHCVIFQDNLENLNVSKYGPQIETNSIFPKKANVSFVNVTDKAEIHMRVWERGVGETSGCGSGACAATVAGVLNGLTDRKVLVHLKGGKLEVEWEKESNSVILTGPAEKVCDGEYYIS